METFLLSVQDGYFHPPPASLILLLILILTVNQELVFNLGHLDIPTQENLSSLSKTFLKGFYKSLIEDLLQWSMRKYGWKQT